MDKNLKLRVDLVIHKSVSSMFALFSCQRVRGENFDWRDFSGICLDLIGMWLDSSNIPQTKDVLSYATVSTEELCEKLITLAEYK